MSALSSGASSGLTIGGDPFGGQTGFGFQVPQGNPGEIDAAARVISEQASLLSSRGRDVLSGARLASAAWKGQAEGAFSEYAGHVVTVFDANAMAYGEAAQAMSSFARELEDAQRVTGQALRECETSHGQMTSQLQAAAEHGQTASTLTQQAATAFHPQMQSELTRQAGIAQGQQDAANRAANAARGQFEAAQRQGIQAWERYQHQAQATARQVQGAAERVQMVERLPGGVAPLLAGGPGGVAIAGTPAAMATAFASPFAPIAGGDEEAGIVPGLPLSTLDEYGILTGGAASGLSAYARQQMETLEEAPHLSNRLTALEEALDGPLAPADRAYAEATASQLAGELADLPAQSLSNLRQLANFSDHFAGPILGGGVDSGIRIIEGQNVVKSVSAGVGTTAGGYVGGAAGGAACTAFVVTAEIAPLCAVGGGAIGGFLGDKAGALVGGLIDDVGNIL